MAADKKKHCYIQMDYYDSKLTGTWIVATFSGSRRRRRLLDRHHQRRQELHLQPPARVRPLLDQGHR